MRIVPGQQICGVDALSLRQAFRRVRNYESFSVLSIAEHLSLSSSRVYRLIKALAAEDYIVEASQNEAGSCWRLTRKARTLALATAAKPLTRVTADRIVKSFIARAMAVNENAELIYIVQDAVIFGSYLTDALRLGDVDIGFRLARRESDGDPNMDVKMRVAIARERGRNFRSWFDELCWPRTEVLLELKSRSRGISLHDMEDDAIFTESLRTQVIIRDRQPV